MLKPPHYFAANKRQLRRLYGHTGGEYSEENVHTCPVLALVCFLAACGEQDGKTEIVNTDPAGTSESTPEPADTTPSQPENSNGSEKVITIDDEDGTVYGTITLTSWLNTENDEFAFADGEAQSWVYWNVGLGGSCIIEPSELAGYTYIDLVAYEQKDGVYFLTEGDNTPYHRLFADGEIHNIAFGDQGGEFPTASYGHPASFIFGTNDGGEPNMEDDLDDFTLKADGTMYLLNIEFYGEDGEYLYSCPSPFFVQGDSGEELQTAGSSYDEAPDSALEVDNPDYSLDDLLDDGYKTWDEMEHFEWDPDSQAD